MAKTTVIAVAASAVVLLAAAWGPVRRGLFTPDIPPEPRETASACAECRPEAEGGAGGPMSIDQVLAERCEHEIPAYECDRCRYEVGVVKVPAALLSGTKPLVRMAEVARGAPAGSLSLTGVVGLNENAAAHVGSRVRGVIAGVSIDLGAEAAEGAELFAVESAEIGQAVAACAKSRALLAPARKTVEREESLFARGVSPEHALIAARAELERAQAAAAAEAHALAMLGMPPDAIDAIDPARAPQAPPRVVVRAPLAGTVLRKHAVPGELVEPGRSVILIADLRTVWVWADVYERDLQAMLALAGGGGGAGVTVAVDAFPDRAFEGACDYVGAMMDEKTRTVKARISVANPARLLRPGMFCRVEAPLPARGDALVAPADAVLQDEGAAFVFVHLKDEYYVRRPVVKGRELRGTVEILDGVEAGTRIVAGGAFLLKSDVLREKMGAGCAD